MGSLAAAFPYRYLSTIAVRWSLRRGPHVQFHPATMRRFGTRSMGRRARLAGGIRGLLVDNNGGANSGVRRLPATAFLIDTGTEKGLKSSVGLEHIFY